VEALSSNPSTTQKKMNHTIGGFWVWLFSLSAMLSRFTHSPLFLFTAEYYFLEWPLYLPCHLLAYGRLAIVNGSHAHGVLVLPRVSDLPSAEGTSRRFA
jgi:hypothetical protein